MKENNLEDDIIEENKITIEEEPIVEPENEPKEEPIQRLSFNTLYNNINEKPPLLKRKNSINNLQNRIEIEKLSIKYEKEPNLIFLRNGKTFSYQTLKYSKDLENLNPRMKSDLSFTMLIKEVEFKYKDIILYNFKDFLLMFGLLMTSSFNFNFLYFPFILCGLLYAILIYKNNRDQRKLKFIINIIVLIYAGLMLLFEIVIMILYAIENETIVNKKSVWINLGVPYLLSENAFDLIKTLFGPVLMIIINIICIVLEKKCNFSNSDISKKKNLIDYPDLAAFYKKVKKYLFISFLIIAAFATFNKSILSMFYLALFYIVLTIFLITSDEMVYMTYKNIVYIELVLIACQLFITNITNTYSLADKYFNNNNESLLYDFLANSWGQFGFFLSYYKEGDYSTPFIDWAGYFFGCICFTSFIFIIKSLSSVNIEDLKRKERNKEKKCYVYIEKSLFGKLFTRIANICSGQYFMLHTIRILAILWIYNIRSFFSIFVIIWLFFSFLYLDPIPIRLLCMIILIPAIYISLICIASSRIFYSYYDDLDDKNKVRYFHFSLGNYDYDLIHFYVLNLFYIIIVCFIVFKPEEKKITLTPKKIKPTLNLINPKKELDLKQPLIEKKEDENNKDNINIISTKSEDIINENNKSINDDIIIKEENNIKINNNINNINININVAKPSLKDILREKDIFHEAEEVTFSNLVKKFIFLHINKITLIVMYFVANKEINLFHFILVIVFMIQLIRPFIIKHIVIYIIILFQILFIVEYIMDLLKVYCLEAFEENLIKIKFFFTYDANTSDTKKLFDTSVEIFIYGAIYCFYIHYQLYNYDYYKVLAQENKVTLSKYIDHKIKSQKAKEVLYKIGRILHDIYTWGIIFFFVLFACYFEVNLLFAIELLFFFICAYQFCILVQESGRNTEKKINLLFPRIVLYFSGINTVLVYLYQVLFLDFTGLKDKIKESDNFFVKNLPSIGFTIYQEDNIFYSLLPHYFLNFISLLYLRRVKFIQKEIEENKKKRDKRREAFKKNAQKEEEKKKEPKKEENIINIENKKTEDKKEEKKEEIIGMQEKRPEEDKKEEIIVIQEKKPKEEKKEGKKGFKGKKGENKEKKEEKDDEDMMDEDEEKKEKKGEREDPRNKAYNAFVRNKKLIRILNIKYFFSMTVITFTKLYWLILFIITGILYTSQDLSAGIFIYIIIFGITFIRMFYSIIMKLSKFMKKETYFISKVIRHHLIEKETHFKNLKAHRDFSFRFLLGYSLLLIFLFYFYGVFDLFQNGCNTEIWKSCEKDRFSPIFEKDSLAENIMISISYLLGFNVNMQEMGILKAGWKHILFASLIIFDVYVQKIEFHFYSYNFGNRREYRTLINKNLRLEPIISLDKERINNDKNILKQIEENCAVKTSNPFNHASYIKKMNQIYGGLLNKIKAKFEAKNLNISKEQEDRGRKNIIRFLQAFYRASNSKILLSESQKKYKFIKGLKKVSEEIIIFLLLCTSIAKLNIWSFVYIIISIYLIQSTKTMRKYYYIFCFTIIAIFAQLLVFISNINPNTDPIPDKKILDIISKTFHMPWYNGDLKYGFFFGLGISKSQINLIWMDLIDIVILYIYIDYFSYCIYQDADNIGQSQDINNKINYYNLRENKKFYNCIKNVSEEKLKEYIDCMKYNLDINISDILVKLGLRPDPNHPKDINKKGLLPNKEEDKKEEKKSHDIELQVNDNIINTNSNLLENSNENIQLIKEEPKNALKGKKIKAKEEEKEEDEEEKIIEEGKNRLKWAFFFGNLIELLYLSFHNVILIIIIIISMMVSGLLSLFYIILSFYFLITSYKMYFGQKYYYPKAIKKILRVAIIVDIAIQILYQMPVLYRDAEEKTTLDKILDVIGFNRIINYGKREDINYDVEDDIEINSEQMVLVVFKAVTYFFMGIQILIYSSQNFQEYYLIYLVTRKLDLKRKSLMNAFRFNNKRINTMNESVKLREEMSLNMDFIEKILGRWRNQLSKADSSSSEKNLNNNRTKSFERRDSFLRQKKKPQKIYEEKKVKDYIKKIILDRRLIRFEMWFYKFSVDYSKINPAEKEIFERDVIQGHTTTKTFIEKMVDNNVDHLKLGDFTEAEMIELKKFFFDTETQLEKMKEQRIKKTEKQKKDLVKSIIPGLIQEKTSLIGLIRKKEEKDKTVDLTQHKFKEIVDLLQSKLFQKYLKTPFLIKSLMIDLLTYCSKKFQFVCYFIMVLNHIENASLLSMVYPVSIFCYAILEYPRPSKNYWNFCIIYSIIVLAIKYILQLQLFVEIFGYVDNADNQSKSSVYVSAIKSIDSYKTGLKYMEATDNVQFFNYIVFDALIIIFLLINNLLLIINGLWEQREQEIENIYHAMDRVAKTKNLLPEDIDNLNEFNDHFLEHDRKEGTLKIKKYEPKRRFGFIEKIKNRLKHDDKSDYTTIDTYNEKNKKYFQRLFPLIRNEKPGNDFYAQYTIGMVLVILFIIVFYTSMVKDVTFDALNQETNQFSDSMILYLILHIFFLCYDRVLYINQNRNSIKYKYIIYKKVNMKQISEIKFNSIKAEIAKTYNINDKNDNFIIPPDYANTLRDEYEILNIQIEEYNKILLQKYILHLFIVIAGHAFIFFYAPLKGNYNLNHEILCSLEDGDYEQCNNFLENSALIWFYLLYMIYFIFSGMQVKFGFYDMKRKSLLKSGYSSINKLINTAFKSIPFIYEIKLCIDWAFTPTSLDLFQWNKYENVYDTVFTTYCNMKGTNVSKIGQVVGKPKKSLMGGLLSFGLVIIIILPILLFSSLNPTNVLNNLIGGNIKIDLSFKDSLGLIKNYTLYESTKPETILDYKENEDEFKREWDDYAYSDSVEVKNFPTEQIQRLNFSSTSERNWGLTKPHIQNLIKLLNFNDSQEETNTNKIVEIQLIIDYKFERYLPVEARTPGERHGIILYDKTNNTLNNTIEITKIREAIDQCKTAEATFKNLYSAPIRLTANAKSREITDEDIFSNLDVFLGFTGCKKLGDNISNIDYDMEFDDNNNQTNISYLESYFTFGTLGKNGKEGIFFYVLSDKVSSTTSGYSIITFYVTFVLLVGNYVRNFFAGEPSKITLTEMPDCYDIINICEGIKTARYSFDFEQEEKLYYILMELMRSPDYLKNLTSSSVDQFGKRKEMTEKSNDPNAFADEEMIK